MDNVSKEKRSEIMSKIRSKNTTPEIKVRKLLHSMGYRFRLHRKDLPGKPDIVLPKYKTVIFVHGCFWHGHEASECKLSRLPKSKVDFWEMKISLNKKRDINIQRKLSELGWHFFIVWECQTLNNEKLRSIINEGFNAIC